MPRRTIFSLGIPDGNARAPSSKPSQSRLPSALSGMLFPVAVEKKLTPYEKSTTG
jgi:hypothetical protein